MHIKRLMLGSAVAVAAVSDAHAADAIIAAEPEAMEYVRVCDAFGSGYFYIPGTETCLKIGGYVRVDFNGGDVLGQDTFANPDAGLAESGRPATGGGDSWGTRSRFDLRVSSASDTEYGALKTYAEIYFDRDNNTAASSTLAHGYLEFAGFLIGYTDTLFSGGFIGGGYAMNDYIFVNYGNVARTMVRYTYGGTKGLAITAAVEDGSDAQLLPSVDGDDTYVPNIVGGIGYRADSFEAFLVGGYDSDVEEGAIKGRVNVKAGPFSAFVMAGWNTDGNETNDYARWSGDWAVWLGAQYQATEKLAIYGDVNFMEEGVGGDAGKFESSVGMTYTVVPGFVVRPEVSYVADYSDLVGDEANDWGAKLRFQRSF